ncbi:MAG: non-canonical purine NTP pyrophosphatase, RdgB/HAM1 family [Thermoplasmata archaeon]|nr:XTP/dITP diphosphatase [Euryarchaeota archaeon]RLF67152.1 MAG: non-canonical purine NTP pyrophosphatase, RdgB/HAM1 family [Thermoplasmata archaeon]
MRKLVFITSNEHKFREAREILKEYNIKLERLSMPVEEIQADSIEEVAYHSMKSLVDRKIIPAMAFLEDAGLFIRALKGFPGVYSAYVYKTIGCRGILKLMENVKDRYAEFRSAVALYDGKSIHVFTGVCKGTIGFEERGSAGFGFDPIFVPEGYNKTYAELGEEIKNKISHRSRAILSMVKYLVDYLKF